MQSLFKITDRTVVGSLVFCLDCPPTAAFPWTRSVKVRFTWTGKEWMADFPMTDAQSSGDEMGSHSHFAAETADVLVTVFGMLGKLRASGKTNPASVQLEELL